VHCGGFVEYRFPTDVHLTGWTARWVSGRGLHFCPPTVTPPKRLRETDSILYALAIPTPLCYYCRYAVRNRNDPRSDTSYFLVDAL
jgi:hypothetical protein